MNAVSPPRGTICIIGFDSAWTDNEKARGAICALFVAKDGTGDFRPPQLVTFDEARDFIETQRNADGICLVAIDQPTIVPNQSGCRPVDRVAGSLISFVGGGVQPANRSKIGMFDDDAPIWRFKERLGAIENPEACRAAASGLYIIEVYPYLALPTLNLAFGGRLKGPKYNPANKKFQIAHWRAVIETVACYARINRIEGVSSWANQLAEISTPKKADQDRLDSVLCALVGYHWCASPRSESIMIGDLTYGYMIAPVCVDTWARLAAAAGKRAVPVDGYT